MRIDHIDPEIDLEDQLEEEGNPDQGSEDDLFLLPGGECHTGDIRENGT
jgi:hypothetical protein